MIKCCCVHWELLFTVLLIFISLLKVRALGTQHHKQLELQTLKVAGENGAKSESQPLNNELENFKGSEMLQEDKSSSVKESVVTGASLSKIVIPSQVFDVRDFGAVGDGFTLCTKAFQGALFAASQNYGGGIVKVENGTYLTGSIQLKSNTFLYLDADAFIIGSTELKDYPLPWISARGMPVLVYSENATNVGIIGNGGAIDGSAVPAFVASYSRDQDKFVPQVWIDHTNCTGECRPMLVEFNSCKNVLMQNVTLQNSPDWTSHYVGCDNVYIENVTVLGDFRWPNNDGIDPDSSRNVTIRNCYVDVGDDAICLKAKTAFGVLDNVLVESCQLRSRSSGVKFGSATAQNMTNVLVRDVFIWSSNRGLGIQHRDAGNISNVEFRNIVIDGCSYQPTSWWGASEAVWLSSIRRNFSSTDAVGRVSNIRYVNITSRAEGGNLISSRTAYPLENLFFENVVLNIDEWQPRRPSLNYTPPSHDYRPVIGTPAVVPFATNGFYFEHVLNATLQNCSVVFGQPKQQSWGKCLNGTQMSHVTRDNFHCIHQS